MCLFIFFDLRFDFVFELFNMYGTLAAGGVSPDALVIASAVSGSAPATGPHRNLLESLFFGC